MSQLIIKTDRRNDNCFFLFLKAPFFDNKRIRTPQIIAYYSQTVV